jgi:hypothetical protein
MAALVIKKRSVEPTFQTEMKRLPPILLTAQSPAQTRERSNPNRSPANHATKVMWRI